MKNQQQENSERRQGQDIIDLILEDHKPLKELIRVMKDSEKDLSERKQAFEKFAPLLLQHAKPEEQALYTFMTEADDLAEEGFEGAVEHELADKMIEEVKASQDDDRMSACIKVLAEVVEHHIEEEEDEMFPDLKKKSSSEERRALGNLYLEFRTELGQETNRAPQSQPGAELHM